MHPELLSHVEQHVGQQVQGGGCRCGTDYQAALLAELAAVTCVRQWKHWSLLEALAHYNVSLSVFVAVVTVSMTASAAGITFRC